MEINIDQSLCCGDSLCTKICPGSFLIMENGKATKNPNGACISCGHCIAICPTKAINMDMDGTIAYGEDGANLKPISPESFLLLAKSRRSTRFFQQKEIPSDEILKALNMTRYAPTAKNQQYIKWITLHNKEKIREIASIVVNSARSITSMKPLVQAFDNGADPILRNAPCFVGAYCHKKHLARFGLIDATISTTYLELFLPLIGLGTCWAGFVMAEARANPTIQELLELPKDHVLCTALMVGYPKFTYKAIPPRNALQVSIIK